MVDGQVQSAEFRRSQNGIVLHEYNAVCDLRNSAAFNPIHRPIFQFIGYIARHSETLEELVVYQALYGEGGIWVRPVTMFLENVIVEGNSLPRFKLVQS